MKLGRAKRIFGVALKCASAELRKIKEENSIFVELF